MSIARIDPLTRENYDTWVIQAEAILVRKKYWKYIEDPPTSDATAIEKEDDRQARAELILIIAPSELKQINKCTTAKAVWDKLKEIYASKGPARKASLLKQLILTKLDGNDIKNHLNKFMDIVDKLADMDVDINENLLTILMLYSLSQDYDNFRVAIESRDILPKPEELKIKIIEECEARHSKNMANNDEPETVIQEEVFYASCKLCKRKGNNIFKHKHHKICTSCWKKNGGKQNTTFQKHDKNNFITQCLLTHNKKTENNTWVLDSGCTSHMTYQRHLFDKIESTSSKLNFATEEHTAEVKGKGTVSFITKNGDGMVRTYFKDTLYVPSLCTNLLSVSKMTDAGCSVIFSKTKAMVNNPKAGVTLIAHKKDDGLYYIKPDKLECNNLVNDNDDTVPVIKKSNASNINVWHRKLGHMNAKDLKLALKNDILIGLNFDVSETLDECEACVQAKLHRKPALCENTTQRTTERLEIVHSDVCGPIKTPTVSGNQYFVTFIDDYSRYCRIYLMKNKSEVLEKFKEFKELAETHTGNKIKFLQSDNGTEYVNKEFDKYLKHCGIQRRLTAPYTPHQNGLAERKNRTLVEKARAMMIDAKVPIKLWGEAVNTANYLSNRSINSAIHNQTPFELWVGRKPCINHLYVFGSKTYVLKKGPNGHKFASKAIPGIFAGYSETAKAFRIFIPTKNKIIISKDIRVMKTMFFDELDKNELSSLDFIQPRQSSSQRLNKQVVIDLCDNQQLENDCNKDEQENVMLEQNQVNVIAGIQQQEPINVESDYESLSGSFDNDSPEQNANNEENAIIQTRLLRDRSKMKAPKRYEDCVGYAAEEIENVYKPKKPMTFKETMDFSDKQKRQEAMLSEITSLKKKKQKQKKKNFLIYTKGRKAS